MTNPKMNVTSKAPAFSKNQAIVIGVTMDNKKVKLVTHRVDSSSIAGINFESLGVKTKNESVTRIPGPNGSVFVLVGIGQEVLDEDSLREVAGAVSRSVAGLESIVFDLPTEDPTDAVNILEGAALGLYEFNAYKGDPKLSAVKVSKLTVLSDHKVTAAAISRTEILVETVFATRHLVNTPPNDLYPESFTAIVQKRVKGLSLTVEVWDEKRLAADGFGGILAVGKGSTRPPRLVKISYKPKGAAKHLALVGKGITFDSGGLSLKPAESMVGMKYDMTGAATVFEALIAIAKLDLTVEATAWLCLAENLPSGSATRPNDVIKIRNGKTVEVLNTDAEGRLVLADGLSAASETNPDLIIDVATLTGAATIALGNRYAGLMGTAEAISAVEAAAFDAGELVWHMPLPVELRSLLDSDIADIANVKIGNRAGGMLIGGLFLKEFVGKPANAEAQKLAWAHLDIAGPANNDAAAYGHTPRGATGAIVRTLVSVAEEMSRG